MKTQYALHTVARSKALMNQYGVTVVHRMSGIAISTLEKWRYGKNRATTKPSTDIQQRLRNVFFES